MHSVGYKILPYSFFFRKKINSKKRKESKGGSNYLSSRLSRGSRRPVFIAKQPKPRTASAPFTFHKDSIKSFDLPSLFCFSSMEVPSSWDALRKQARKLEAQLDERMNSYRKLVSANVSTKADTAESDLESWIEQLLKQLQQVNSQMQAWVSSGGSEMVSHTLTRHQEILQDLAQEFYRLRSSLRAKQEHASLLEDFKEFDRTRLDLEEGAGSEQLALLKEHASISRSTGQMDSVISQAQATLGALVFQRSTFGGINSKLSNVSSRLPTVNNILSAIKRKKSMDTIILSLVASVCTFLIFIYWLTK